MVSGRECEKGSGASAADRVSSLTRDEFWNRKRDWGLPAREQQLKSILACCAHFDEGAGWAGRESLPSLGSLGQQLWREGEGSGLGAGGVPACATTAARDGMPEHARTRRLTDHARSETIRITPVDRLLVIAGESLRLGRVSRSDWHHMAASFSRASGHRSGLIWKQKRFCCYWLCCRRRPQRRGEPRRGPLRRLSGKTAAEAWW